jgi:putative component of toxin-antitoxin plasmid stabilization module
MVGSLKNRQTPVFLNTLFSNLPHLTNNEFCIKPGLIELKWLNGIRVYTFMWGTAIVVALHGGNKNGQSRDIKKSKKNPGRSP